MENKYYANKGAERNKKPLQNKVYFIELSQLKGIKKEELEVEKEKYAKYKFKELGYLVLNWQYEKLLNKHKSWNFHGFITPEKLKEVLGDKQWAKFCNGKRTFVIQRRIDGKNISKNSDGKI